MDFIESYVEIKKKLLGQATSWEGEPSFTALEKKKKRKV